MSYVNRRVLIGQAQEIYNSLLENLGHLESYGRNVSEYVSDLEVIAVLSNWLRAEFVKEKEADETKMDGELGFGTGEE
jgi:hypothetical protein